MRKIKLSQGMYALVSNDWYEMLNSVKWYIRKLGKTFYASTCQNIDNKWKEDFMHQVIMDFKGGNNLIIDHKDMNGLNNTVENLRVANRAQNLQNTKKCTPVKTSTYKGVCKNTKGKFRAVIVNEKKQVSLGIYKSEISAALAYNKAALSFFGSFARINNIHGCIEDRPYTWRQHINKDKGQYNLRFKINKENFTIGNNGTVKQKLKDKMQFITCLLSVVVCTADESVRHPH